MLGLVGSAHCVGMCGPIVIALQLNRESWVKKFIGGLLYNVGRTITYGILGALFGLFGQGLRLAGFQQWVSIILGIIMILSVFFPLFLKNNALYTKFISGYSSRLLGKFGKHFRTGKYSSLFIIGLFNGLLPCGLVYIAVAGAIETGHFLDGTAFMFAFGAGTTPLLYLLGIFSNTVSGKIRHWMNKVLPILIVLVGILFILRGMNLGIKYISPKDKVLELHQKTDGKPCCH